MSWVNQLKILFVAAAFAAMCAAPSWAQMDGFPDMKKRAKDKMQERRGEHDGPQGPPMLVLVPPPDAEKPEDVEMSDDPEERHGQILETFFRMMDGDGSGELNFDELGAWAHPAPMGPGMGGEMDEEMRRRMEEEIRRHVEEEIRHQLEEEMKRRMEEMRGGEGGEGGGGGDMEEEIRRRVEQELHRHMREMRREQMQRMREELREMHRHEMELKEELARIRDHIREMQNNLQREDDEGGDNIPGME